MTRLVRNLDPNTSADNFPNTTEEEKSYIEQRIEELDQLEPIELSDALLIGESKEVSISRDSNIVISQIGVIDHDDSNMQYNVNFRASQDGQTATFVSPCQSNNITIVIWLRKS